MKAIKGLNSAVHKSSSLFGGQELQDISSKRLSSVQYMYVPEQAVKGRNH